MPPPPANINAAWASLLISLLERSGITQVVASPGSRSTPLTVAAARNEAITTTMHFDERGAAFFALGLARATGQPTALICTSGSAVANYFPAVVEASMDNVPLLLLTSDRPPELQGKGANQTIPQQEIYGQFARASLELPPPIPRKRSSTRLKRVAKALENLHGLRPGPVHVNCPFREPLAPDPDEHEFSEYVSEGTQWMEEYLASPFKEVEVLSGDQTKFFGRLTTVRRGIIVAGKLDNISDREAVLSFSERSGWPILPDIQSGLRVGCGHPNVISYIDQLLLSGQKNDRFRTDGVLHIGGRVLSKRLLEWLNDQQLKCYYRVDASDLKFDPNNQQTLFYPGEIPETLGLIRDGFEWSCDETWLQLWQPASRVTGDIIHEVADTDKRLTELSACRCIGHSLAGALFHDTAKPTLWAASSLPIRMFDMYADSAGTPVDVQSNRGASGIDGTIASAAGYAAGSQKPLVLVIGDLAFLHDLNSLDLVRRSAVPITIVLLNNDGGNIFSLLPIAKHTDVFEQYFRTPHGLTFKHAAQQFGLPYTQTDSLENFRETFAQSLATGKSSLIEVTIDHEAGPLQMRNIADMIRSRFDGG